MSGCTKDEQMLRILRAILCKNANNDLKPAMRGIDPCRVIHELNGNQEALAFFSNWSGWNREFKRSLLVRDANGDWKYDGTKVSLICSWDACGVYNPDKCEYCGRTTSIWDYVNKVMIDRDNW